MFLEVAELNTVIYQYQLNQITENDDTIALQAINAAIEEVKSYLASNNQTKFNDGRLRYDADAVFASTGTDRNPLILELTKTVAEWWAIRLCNAEILHQSVKERYDRAIKYLREVNSGEVTINGLPLLVEDETSEDLRQAFRAGSRTKFNHY